MATGTRYSYTDTGNTKRAISDVIEMIDWTEAPLLRIFGFSSSNVSKFNIVNWPATKVEILEDTMSTLTATLDEVNEVNEDDFDVQTDEGALFRQGDIILVDSEQMLVTSVSGDNLSVTRPWGGTTEAEHADDSVVTIIGRTMPEASDYVTGNTTATTQPYNYTQIISEAVKVSKTDIAIQKYGIEDTMDYHVAKLFADGGGSGRLAQMLAKTFYYGKRVQRTASSTYSGMGGFDTFVTENVTTLSGSPALKRDNIHTIIRQVRDAGGRVDKLITGSWGIEKITQMYEGTIRTTRDETRGGSEITMIKTPHGEVEVVYDWMCPGGQMYFVNSDKTGWLPLREFSAGEIKEQGDYFVKDIVGEYTFLMCNDESHGKITGFSTSK
jgi:hypothetical protein